jgi:ATP-dependent Clp protease protease subunit
MASTTNIQNKDILFFGEVDDWGFASGFFAETLAQNEGEELEFLINSPGGAVFEGINIASILQRREGRTITTATGLAASIATVILLAGDVVQMDEDAFLMIHDAWAYEAGDAKELRKTARLLDKISAQIAEIYTNQIEKAGKLIDGDKEKTRSKMRELMRAETWLTAQEALNIGLIDRIVSGRDDEEKEHFPMPAENRTDSNLNAKFYNCLKGFKNTPKQLLNKYDTKPMEKDKKSLWQSIKAFFAPELKAEIEAAQLPATEEEQPTTIENETEKEMTQEEMIQALKEQGFEVSAKEVEPQPEEKAEETTDVNAQLLTELKAMKEKQSKLEAQLKDAQFAKAGKSAAGKGEEKETEKGPNVGAQNKAAFASLAALITE